MRISSQLLRSRAARPLHGVEHIDLSRLDLVSVERLELCPKLQSLNLRGNRIEAVPNIDCCLQLWKIDLANNRLRSLEGLCHFTAFGSLVLSNNELEWKELQKIRHLHILDLALHGNPQLEIDAYYRMHVIDSLPLIWMLDGRIITSAERAQVRQFFKDSSYSDRPVRHKLPKKQFIPTSLKNIMTVNGLHGQRTDHMMRRFPQKTTQNIDLDKKRLHYLAYNLQQDVNLENKHKSRGKFKVSHLIENLIMCRKEDQERCNMLLLLLVASLEFAIPSTIVHQTLEVARLSKIEKIETMDLFMFSREIRCRIVSLLLCAVKIERDQSIDGGLYNRLYLGLYDLVSDLIRLANGDDIVRYQAIRKKFDSRKSGYRSLLASEVVQLLCIVPVFFDYIGRDPGVMDLISVATKDSDIGEQIKAFSWRIQSEGGGVSRVYHEIGQFLLHKAKEANVSSLINPVKSSETLNSNSLVYRVEPSYIITSKRLVQVTPERPHSSAAAVSSANHGNTECDGRSSRSPPRAATALGVRTTHSIRTRAKTAKRKPALNDRVEIGHQACGRLVALPETHVGLVQLDSVAAPRFQQADYSVKDVNIDGQFHYVNFRLMVWDSRSGRWKKTPPLHQPYGSRQDGHRKRSNSDSETKFLSEALQQSLQLRVDVPAPSTAELDNSPPDTKYEGRTLINNHVRSIVRECLQEAELQWPEDESWEDTTQQAAWVEPERTETPVVDSEVTANVDSESFSGNRELEDENTEQSELAEYCDDDVDEDGEQNPELAAAFPEHDEHPRHTSSVPPNTSRIEIPPTADADHASQEEMYYFDQNNNPEKQRDAYPKMVPGLYEPEQITTRTREESYGMRDLSYELDHRGSPSQHNCHIVGSGRFESASPGERSPENGLEAEDLVSLTENARLNAWRSSEAMKRATSSGVPSRVGSATSRANQQERNQERNPPPQRPTSPSHAGPLPVKSADRWLAGGKDVNKMSKRLVSTPLPGWLEGLQEQRRRPQSSPVRSQRRPMSSVSTGSRISRQTSPSTAVHPARGAAAVYVSGRTPPSFTRIQSARVAMRRR